MKNIFRPTQNQPLTNQEIYPNISPGMPSHAFSLTKGLKNMRVLHSPGVLITIAVMSLMLISTKLIFGEPRLPLVWTPKQVVEFVQPNITKTVSVTFKTNTNLNNVTFFTTPALRGVVSVNPRSYSSITANTLYTVSLTINPGSVSQSKYEGTVHLKDSMNYATNALPLPVMVVVHNEPVPSDPGEAGKQTLEGIDSDNDGVRDDLQRWIVLNYYWSQKRVASLRQYIGVNEEFLIDAGDKQLSIKHSQDRERAIECADYVFGLSEMIKATDELKSQLLNTEARSKAYIKANSQLGGTFSLRILPSQRKDQCKFNPDLVVN